MINQIIQHLGISYLPAQVDSFKQQYSFEERQSEAKRIGESYPDKVPVIVQRGHQKTECQLPALNKQKFLCPGDISLAQFQYVIRKRLALAPNEALFFTVGAKALPPSSALLSQLTVDYNDADGFLYITYSSENVFG